MNPSQNIHQRQSCSNLPAFFTGLAENAKIELKKPLLCFLCGSSLSNNVKNQDGLQSDSNDNCENCAKNFNNLKEALSLLSKISSPPVTPPNNQSKEVDLDNSITKRKSLLPLPHPEQSCTSNDSYFRPPEKEILQNRNTKDDFDVPNDLSPNFKRKNDSPHSNSKRSRSRLSPNVLPHPSNPEYHNKFYERLDNCIWDLYMENKQTEIVYNQKMALREKLHEILLTTFPTCGLYVVGSSMTGLGANSSDMDMCLMLTHAEIDQEKEATNILHTVHDVFLSITYLKDVQVIYAKVPILRFTDCIGGIDVDLNVNNAVGIRNTQLLSSYARMDERFPPLVLIVKMWAQYHGINDAKNNTLSSYSLVLMVIHYLQYGCKPPVLPCLQKLQPDKYHPKSDVRKLKLREVLPDFTSENKMNLGGLFVGFLKYFSQEFDYFRSVMSVRLGSLLPKEVAMNNTFSSKNKKAHWKWVCIEEPFELTNTACAVFKPGVFRYIKQVFSDSCKRISRTADLGSIM